MCLTIPRRVLEVSGDGHSATVDTGGPRRQVPLMILADDGPVKAGDWLLLGAGLAIARLDDNEAVELLALLDQGGRDER